MGTKSLPPLSPEDLTTESLAASVDSAIKVIEERLANLAEDPQGAKWSVSDLVKLLQLRSQLQADRPRNITVRWVDNRIESE